MHACMHESGIPESYMHEACMRHESGIPDSYDLGFLDSDASTDMYTGTHASHADSTLP